MIKKALIPVALLVLAAAALVSVCVLNGPVIRARTSAEAADLPPELLADLKRKAIDEGDKQAAARIYWYYRFTKRDYVETKKWKWAVEKYPGEDDGLPK